MSTTEHKPGVHAACLVNRHLKLEGLDALKVETIAQEIDGLLGVDSVFLDEDSQYLDIAYDASHLSIDDVEAIVRKHGRDLDHGWWTHFQEGWYRFTDQECQG